MFWFLEVDRLNSVVRSNHLETNHSFRLENGHPNSMRGRPRIRIVEIQDAP